MKKDTLEEAFKKAGITPAGRRTIEGRDVLLGDGFCSNPEIAFKKFGVEPGEFENGCYVSAWLWSQDDQNVGLGRPLFFDPLHDVETMALAERKQARLNKAAEDAANTLKRLKEHEGHAFAI